MTLQKGLLQIIHKCSNNTNTFGVLFPWFATEIYYLAFMFSFAQNLHFHIFYRLLFEYRAYAISLVIRDLRKLKDLCLWKLLRDVCYKFFFVKLTLQFSKLKDSHCEVNSTDLMADYWNFKKSNFCVW